MISEMNGVSLRKVETVYEPGRLQTSRDSNILPSCPSRLTRFWRTAPATVFLSLFYQTRLFFDANNLYHIFLCSFWPCRAAPDYPVPDALPHELRNASSDELVAFFLHNTFKTSFLDSTSSDTDVRYPFFLLFLVSSLQLVSQVYFIPTSSCGC